MQHQALSLGTSPSQFAAVPPVALGYPHAVGALPASGAMAVGALPAAPFLAAVPQAGPTQFLSVTGMVTPNTLVDDEEYQEVRASFWPGSCGSF